MDVLDPKRAAALAALEELPEHGVIGLGTGSTAKIFIDELAKLVHAGRKLVGVPTSQASRAQAEALGVPLLDDAGPWSIDVTVDGADEVDASLNLIKGGGAAHTREKIVNHASRRNVIVVDPAKLSQKLGESWHVPIEVLAFGHATTARALGAHGVPALRTRDGAPVRTDAGNLIYDLKAGVIADPAGLDAALHAIPGVVETGLFVARVDVVIVGGTPVRRLDRARAR
jgi:ribose 5-phosphate isomerase A